MTETARARTNAIGQSVGNLQDGVAGLTCKTDQFKIDTRLSYFEGFQGESFYEQKYRNKKLVVAHLINHENTFLDIIGQIMFENNYNLTVRVYIYQLINSNKHSTFEVRTKEHRFRCYKGRVYKTVLNSADKNNE